MNVIYLLLRSSSLIVAIAILAGLISGGSSARLIALINNAISSNNSASVLVSSFAALALVTVLSRFISELLLIHLSQKVISETRLILSRQVLAAPLRDLEKLGNSRLLATLTDDVRSLADAVAFIPSLCIAIAVVVGCLFYLAWLSWVVFLCFVGFLVVAMLSYQLLTQKAKDYLTLAREEEDNLFSHFRAITQGIKELKLNRKRRLAFFSEQLEPTVALSRHYNILGMTAFTIGLSWSQLLLFVAIGLIDFGLPRIMTINQSVLSGYALTIIFLVVPLDAITTILPRISKASVALQKIETIRLTLASGSEHSSVIVEPEPFSELQLRGVTHAYREESDLSSFTVKPVDLTFHPQEIVFLVGGNGGGKSTLAKLIAGLYVPEAGDIIVDGQCIKDEKREWYRQHFSAIFSDFYLFDQLLGLDGNGDREIQEYLVKLELERKVQVKDGKFSTTALSQGQRKRLALLSAYLEDRPFYIFDEWASDQDPVFKDIFYTQLLPELKSRGKTVLAISHDDRYFHLADRVLKLDYGCIL